MVMGDFNQWEIGGALKDFPDLKGSDVGPRGSRSINRILSNLYPHADNCGTVPPLDPDLSMDGAPSDHRVAFLTCNIPRVKKFKWLSYSYRYLNDDSTESLGSDRL